MLENTEHRQFLEIYCTLIEIFLIDADNNVLDISCKVLGNTVAIQVVMLTGTTLSMEKVGLVRKRLQNANVEITERYLTKDQFNQDRGDWCIAYDRLDHVLFSKAEA